MDMVTVRDKEQRFDAMFVAPRKSLLFANVFLGYDAKKCDKYHAYDAASNNTVDLGSLTDPMSDVGDFSSTDDGHV
jgi:hypothetical protein